VLVYGRSAEEGGREIREWAAQEGYGACQQAPEKQKDAPLSDGWSCTAMVDVCTEVEMKLRW
jgi:hypothetical protein